MRFYENSEGPNGFISFLVLEKGGAIQLVFSAVPSNPFDAKEISQGGKASKEVGKPT